jgi:pimeloyl-ACP methyl ester carboxylesterase
VLVGASTHFPDQARAIMRRFGAGEVPEFVREFYTACATRGAGQVDTLMRQFAAFEHSRSDVAFSAADLARIRARTLVVHGDRDDFFPVALYRGIRRAALWIVPGGDHVPIYGARTGPFLDETLRFLADATTFAP